MIVCVRALMCISVMSVYSCAHACVCAPACLCVRACVSCILDVIGEKMFVRVLKNVSVCACMRTSGNG